MTGGQRDLADPPSTAPAVDLSKWQALKPDQKATGSTDQLLAVLATNPLTDATLPVPVQCELPSANGLLPREKLDAFLTAGGDCLAATWQPALKKQGIEFAAPQIVVYDGERSPAGTACSPGSFTHDAPRSCLADSTLYWPATWDPGFSNTQGDETAQLYMWHLSYSYAMFAFAAVDLDAYYTAAQSSVEGDQARVDDLSRRRALQLSCLGSAAAFQLPAGSRPGDRVEAFVTSPEAQADPVSGADPSAAARAAWVDAGRSARGSLSACDTWSVDAGEVR